MGAAEDWDLLQVEDLDGMDEAALEAEIARHEAELAAAAAAAGPAPARNSGSSSDGSKTVEVEAVGPSSHPATTSTSAPSTSTASASTQQAGSASQPTVSLTTDLVRQLEKLQEENEKMKQALASGHSLSPFDSRVRASTGGSTDLQSVLSLSAARSKSMAGQAGATAELERQVAEGRRRLEFKQRGVDVAILMDCTGSMSTCIEAVKSKALDIMSLAPSIHPDAITRLGFVGYRDFYGEAGDGHFVVQDFVDQSSFSTLNGVIRSVRANGGGNAEDVTGALNKALGLSWCSTTRLIIHFGDSPCHGNKYHNGYPVNGPDTYPAGNPDGLVPEELLRQLVVNRVDYHFARIGRHTDIMTRIFKQVYDESPGGASFEIHEYTNQANDFMPLVLKSLTSSMRRSYRPSSGRSSASSSKSPSAAAAVSLPSLYHKLV